MSTHPLCFTSAQQWQEWRDAATNYLVMCRAPDQRLSRRAYCTDCTEEYRAEMIAQSRCGNPKGRIGD